MTADIFTEEWTPIGSHGLEYRCGTHDSYYVIAHVRFVREYGIYPVGNVWSARTALAGRLFRAVYNWEREFERHLVE